MTTLTHGGGICRHHTTARRCAPCHHRHPAPLRALQQFPHRGSAAVHGLPDSAAVPAHRDLADKEVQLAHRGSQDSKTEGRVRPSVSIRVFRDESKSIIRMAVHPNKLYHPLHLHLQLQFFLLVHLSVLPQCSFHNSCGRFHSTRNNHPGSTQ